MAFWFFFFFFLFYPEGFGLFGFEVGGNLGLLTAKPRPLPPFFFFLHLVDFAHPLFLYCYFFFFFFFSSSSSFFFFFFFFSSSFFSSRPPLWTGYPPGPASAFASRWLEMHSPLIARFLWTLVAEW